MILQRIDPSSCAKVYGFICLVIGFLIGLVFAAIAWMTSGLMDAAGAEEMGGGLSVFFGAGAIILFPIIYGVAGFILGYLSAAIYNGAAKFIGGIELEFE